MRSRISGSFALLALLCAAPAFAQQSDTAVVPVGELIVQGTRALATTGGASALEVRLDSLRIKAAPTLDEVLRRTPLVQVRMNSRGETQFSLRGSGSDARQVAVIVDGIPLNFGWDDRADLSVLPTSAARTLMVARGLPSLLYGPNILGGVVEIGVARGAHEMTQRGVRFDAGVDHTGARALGGALTTPLGSGGRWLLRAGGGHRARDGVALPHDVSEPVTVEDDRRLNTDLDHTDGFASLSYRAPRGAWSDVSVSAYSAQRGIPAELHIASPRFWRYPEVQRLFAVAAGGTGMRHSPMGGTGDVELSAGVDLGSTAIDQFSSRTYQTVAATEESDDQNVTLRLRADQSVGAGELRAGLTYSDINHDEVLKPGVPGSYRQRLWSGALEVHAPVRALGAGTRVSIGAAIDGADTPESSDKPPLEALTEWGARAGVTSVIGSGLMVHAGASRRARFPSLRELYSGALGRFEPNPALKPEQLTALEAGASLARGHAQLQAVAFHHMLNDAIVRIAAADRKFKRVNRDRQTGTGLELLGALRAGRAALSADVVVQETKLEDPAAGTDLIAEYQPSLIASAGVASELVQRVRVDLYARYTGEQQCVNPDTGGNTRIAASQRIDGELSRTWRLGARSSIELAGGIDNITDEAIFDQCGLPQAGRTLRIQLRVR
jgi:iron complex outermembrane recepter protein